MGPSGRPSFLPVSLFIIIYELECCGVFLFLAEPEELEELVEVFVESRLCIETVATGKLLQMLQCLVKRNTYTALCFYRQWLKPSVASFQLEKNS